MTFLPTVAAAMTGYHLINSVVHANQRSRSVVCGIVVYPGVNVVCGIVVYPGVNVCKSTA